MKINFSKQEEVVLDEFSKLLIQKEVGNNLHVCRSTIDTHVMNIKNKIYDHTGVKITTKEELIIFWLCQRKGIEFDLYKIKKEGICSIF